MTLSAFFLTVAIGLAGAVGAVSRYTIGLFITIRAKTSFPVGTFVINITGAFLIGLVFALAAKKVVSPMVQSLVATGFIGGFTTFSTMSWEGMQLTRTGNNVQSLLYFGSTFVVGMCAGILGLALGQVL